ncbi:hypothetical protein A167_00839 [Alcanivorax sp. S71-1-4]|uniref:hypothetical protein n=1 Tax=Alcanivorax sp. S71-1-4 TaxID=1177159 RepID=UPI0013582F86|nr:hypothetical protein [Alcanivorax sp. S71-1-4]KAF0810559.1 hypothetical protein A167_00839 [Alcanivorax sp. S71-1-4]
MRSLAVFMLLSLLAAAGCTASGSRGGFYTYVDDQGNLITGQLPVSAPAPEADTPRADTLPASVDEGLLAQVSGDAPVPDSGSASPQADETPADETEERFVTYVDGDGQITRQVIDLGAARRAEAARGPGYDLIGEGGEAQEGYIETVTPVAADCCRELLADAETLRPGQEVMLTFNTGQAQQIRVGQRLVPARVLTLRREVAEIRVLSFKQHGRYLHPQLLLLDEQGVPVLQVDNVFTRRFPETWARYAYIDGTLPREAGHRYLVVYLGYADGGLPGLVTEADSELVIDGGVVVRGY